VSKRENFVLVAYIAVRRAVVVNNIENTNHIITFDAVDCLAGIWVAIAYPVMAGCAQNTASSYHCYMVWKRNGVVIVIAGVEC